MSNEGSREREYRSNPKTKLPRKNARSMPRIDSLIIQEDRDIIVVDKPIGVISASPIPDSRPNIFELLKERMRHSRDPRNNRRSRVGVVHRLDMDASGLLVYSKNSRALDILKEQLGARSMRRSYLVLVEGRVQTSSAQASLHSKNDTGPSAGDAVNDTQVATPEGAKPDGTNQVGGTIQSMLVEGRDGIVRPADQALRPRDRSSHPGPSSMFGPRGQSNHTPMPRNAMTHYTVIAATDQYSLLRVRLVTGRKHQIRAHMTQIGHPIAGDRHYGAQTNPLNRLGLHACELSLKHPADGKLRTYRSSAPSGFYLLAGAEAPANDNEHDQHSETLTAESTSRIEPARDDDSSWEHVAGWYSSLVEENRSDHFDRVILPGVVSLLEDVDQKTILDVACGQGYMSAELAELGARVVGIDSSPALIAHARHTAQNLGAARAPEYCVCDARALDDNAGPLGDRTFDLVTCVLAIMNIDPLDSAIRSIAHRLTDGGSAVLVMIHPAFRSPRQTGWMWDRADQIDGTTHWHQFRRVDSYLSNRASDIVMNPGGASSGQQKVTTVTHHRPIQTYVNALSSHGLFVDRMEEWASQRISEPGPRADEENRARNEIPMFLAIRARKVANAPAQ